MDDKIVINGVTYYREQKPKFNVSKDADEIAFDEDNGKKRTAHGKGENSSDVDERIKARNDKERNTIPKYPADKPIVKRELSIATIIDDLWVKRYHGMTGNEVEQLAEDLRRAAFVPTEINPPVSMVIALIRCIWEGDSDVTNTDVKEGRPYNRYRWTYDIAEWLQAHGHFTLASFVRGEYERNDNWIPMTFGMPKEKVLEMWGNGEDPTKVKKVGAAKKMPLSKDEKKLIKNGDFDPNWAKGKGKVNGKGKKKTGGGRHGKRKGV